MLLRAAALVGSEAKAPAAWGSARVSGRAELVPDVAEAAAADLEWGSLVVVLFG
jgi:hypothetical protein